jgi:aminoglycoside phosphotransferase (APT) family kinase protein
MVGSDFFADLVRLEDGKVLVAKSPRRLVLQTNYEGCVDFRDVLEKESHVLTLVSAHDPRVPKPLLFHRDAECCFLLTNHLTDRTEEHAGHEVLQELGTLLRTVHSSDASMAPSPLPTLGLRENILERIGAADRYLQLPELPRLLNALPDLLASDPLQRNSLLHMDVRRANLRISDGQLIGLIDFANAGTGSPFAEFGRIAANKLLFEPLVEGYGFSWQWMKHYDALINLYAFDTLAMLTVVFIEEIPDADVLADVSSRAKQHYASLLAEL